MVNVCFSYTECMLIYLNVRSHHAKAISMAKECSSFSVELSTLIDDSDKKKKIFVVVSLPV